MNKYKILIVCSANKGRSASFHALMQHQIFLHNLPIEIQSAGSNGELIRELYEANNTGADDRVIEILKKMGIDEIMLHKTKFAEEKYVSWANIVLTYNTKIRNDLKKWYPKYSDKIMTVRGFLTDKEGDLGNDALDVDDAYRPNSKLYRNRYAPQTIQAYYKVCDESKRLVDAVIQKLRYKKLI